MPQNDATPAEGQFPELYSELRRLANQHFARQPANHTLQPTALINEAYLKLAGHESVPVQGRTHFLSLASRVMRQVLVDHARVRQAEKRGGAAERVTLSDVGTDHELEGLDILAVDDALAELMRLSEQKARLIELRFFGGLTETEAADALGISRASASRQWRLVRAWLVERLAQNEA